MSLLFIFILFLINILKKYHLIVKQNCVNLMYSILIKVNFLIILHNVR